MNEQAPAPVVAGHRVLITGGLGFIGSSLAHACLQRGADVTILDCLDPHSGGNPYNVAQIRDSVRVVHANVLDFPAVAEHVMGTEVIFNCAASTSHQFSMREPWIDLDVNAKGTINLLEAARRFNPGVRLVHLGTSTQLGPLRYRPADEDHAEFPTDIYSADKSVSEKHVLIYARTYGLRATVIRLSNVFGPRAAICDAELTFNNYFVGVALRDGDITVFGNGAQLRNLIYIDDVTDALLMVAEAAHLDGQALFAVGDEHHSVATIAETIVRIFESGRVQYVPWPPSRRVSDVGDAVISNARLKAALPWKPKYDLETGLRQTRAYYEPRVAQYLR